MKMTEQETQEAFNKFEEVVDGIGEMLNDMQVELDVVLTALSYLYVTTAKNQFGMEKGDLISAIVTAINNFYEHDDDNDDEQEEKAKWLN